MSKNAKKQLKEIIKKHENDPPTRPERPAMIKPKALRVSLLDLDECLTYAIQEKVITEAHSNAILNYMKCISDQSGYWDMAWGDIEEKNGMTPGEAKGFRALYEMFKEYEVKHDPKFLHLHFDVGLYS